MMSNLPDQQGGFDPGSLALAAVGFAGSVGAYGLTSENRKADELLTSAVETKYGAILRADKDALAAREKELAAATQEIRDLKAKLALKEKRNVSSPALDGFNRTFQSATPEALKAAIPAVLARLEVDYPQLVTTPADKAAITTMLTFPTTGRGRMMKLPLPVFYTRNVDPVFRQILTRPKGGRRRRRRVRGGDNDRPGEAQGLPAAPVDVDPIEAAVAEATVPGSATGSAASYATTGSPPYEEFAELYATAIRDATKSAFQTEQERSTAARAAVDTKTAARLDGAAAKASKVLADKLGKAIDTATQAIAAQSAKEATIPADRQAEVGELKTALTTTLETATTQRTALAAVTTQEGWTTQGGPAKLTLDSIPVATATYVDAVKRSSLGVVPSPSRSPFASFFKPRPASVASMVNAPPAVPENVPADVAPAVPAEVAPPPPAVDAEAELAARRAAAKASFDQSLTYENPIRRATLRVPKKKFGGRRTRRRTVRKSTYKTHRGSR